ncbi:hypothetical protein CORC01_14152 [Colletotrichum orchidophilum]|uniref:Uncharacterized protein n=1 Tax=Colletotrichum orchidophilum TaxID=1209926 RepID=A0A1G4AN10_9PEZI|nr:uncharacterized protein CORC01_14152 [Colletotrichum orchidophilum]OHE90554.1 hypothetical protein CORC01_14152 [Colletotrichum orchidophilum]
MPSSSRPSKIHYSSSSSSDSDLSSASSSYRHSMDSVSRPIASVEVLRCLRCARAVEATSTDDSSSTGMGTLACSMSPPAKANPNDMGEASHAKDEPKPKGTSTPGITARAQLGSALT